MKHRKTDELLLSLRIYIQLYEYVGCFYWSTTNHLSRSYWSTFEDGTRKKNKQFNITSTTYNVFEYLDVATYLVYDNVLSIKWFLLILLGS